MLLRNIATERKSNIISLFENDKWCMSLRRESEPMDDADEIVEYWFAMGLRRPRAYREKEVFKEAKETFRTIMKGNHPHIMKLDKEQILHSITNFTIAATDSKFRPYKKYLLKKLSIIEFIWEPWNKRSQLLIHLESPKTLETEASPELTQEIYKQFHITRGTTYQKEIPTDILPIFVKASNRVIKYLKTIDNYLQPLMHLSSKTPIRAAYGLIQANRVDRGDFNLAWLHNDYAIANLDQWLKSQGFFKHNQKAV